MTRKLTGFALMIVIAAVTLCFARPNAGQAQDVSRDVSFDPALKIAFVSNQDGDEDIYTMPWDASRTPINLTRNQARDWDPVWSPDGTEIAFNSNRDGLDQIYIMDQDGAPVRPLFTDSTSNDVAPAWSPDGIWIAFASDRRGDGRDLYIAHPDGSEVMALTTTDTIKGDPAWSPDGQEMAYWERRFNGSIQLFVLNVQKPTHLRPISFLGRNNGMVFWSPSGSALYYESDRDGDFQIFSADTVGNNPVALTSPTAHSGRGAISPDGKLIMYTTEANRSDELMLMNADGSRVKALTDNDWSDHSPAWQPVVPHEQLVIAQPTAIPTAATEQAQDASDTSSDVFALGQSINGVEIYPISLDKLKNDYGITAWNQAGWTGAGIKVGVIDLSFGGIDKLEKDTGIHITPPHSEDFHAYDADSADHGTRVLEIIHSIAPGADLFACRYDGTFAEFAYCKDWLIQKEHVQIINHSAGVPVLPLNGTNQWAHEADLANDDNVLWVNSAGNFQRGFYAAPYVSTNGNNLHDFVTGPSPVEKLAFSDFTHYEGHIYLTWDTSEYTAPDPVTGLPVPTQIDPSTGFPVVPDFDLQIVDASGKVLYTSEQRQSEDASLPPSEAISVVTDQPFAVQIVDHNGYGSYSPIKLVLLVEYLGIDSDLIPNVNKDRNSIAPADSKRVLTVGAVHSTDREQNVLTAYSSRGLLDTTDYAKPDLSAYGEIDMGEGLPAFTGTSAAAPVVAGAAALMWETNMSYITAQLRSDLLRSAVFQPADFNQNYGKGVLRLPNPPARVDAAHTTVVIQPKIVFSKAPVAVEAGPVTCGGQPTRLSIGAEGYVNYHRGLALRTEASSRAANIAGLSRLSLGQQFIVLEGPVCNQNMSWWRVELNDGSQGWLGEGDDYYLIAPSNLVQARLPTQFPLECENAPSAEIDIGDSVKIINSLQYGGLTIWRRQHALDVIDALPDGTELRVLGGPSCESNRSIRRWYVRVMDGKWVGQEGWMSEARPTERWLVRRGIE